MARPVAAGHGPWRPLLTWCLLVLAAFCCGGCRGDSDDAEGGDDEPQAEVVSQPVRVQPAQQGLQVNAFKPGHWGAAAFTLRSNHQDLRGEVVSEPTLGAAAGQYEVVAQFARPAVLPKGQAKLFQLRFLLPTVQQDRPERLGIATRFSARRQSLVYDAGTTPLTVMGPSEYFFVGLSDRADEFAYLRASDWVAMPSVDVGAGEARPRAHYRVVFPDGEDFSALPDTFAGWTSTAVLFWDQMAPDRLTEFQQQAILDWLHWGGRLVVTPAGALALRDSFLTRYLPLRDVEQVELRSDDVAGMVRAWSVDGDAKAEEIEAALRQRTGMVGVDGRPAPGASPVVDASELVWERGVGNGRVMLSRFDVSERWFSGWPSNQSFVNAVLLRRPPREYGEARARIGGGGPANAPGTMNYRAPDVHLQLWSSPLRGHEEDPALVTGLRIYARDAGAVLNRPDARAAERTEASRRSDAATDGSNGANEPAGGSDSQAENFADRDGRESSWRRPGWESNSQAGLGGWHGSSGTVAEARRQLRGAAGISIPRRPFVIRTLAGYLVVLVVVNFALFWLLGRLEWAWAMIPLLAVGGAVWVTRAARLDIGFSRSVNELALVELQSGYPRGHLTRVMAVYNSLSSTYEAEFATRDAVITPLGEPAAAGRDAAAPVVYRHGYTDTVGMTAFAVPSNRTGMLRSEEMVPAGDGVRLVEDGTALENGSPWELNDCAVWRLGTEGLEVAVVGPLAPRGKTRLRFVPAERFQGWGELPLGAEALMDHSLRAVPLAAGEVRMTARVDGRLEGLRVEPAAAQRAAQTIVLAHLDYPRLPAPSPDVNLRPEGAETYSGELEDFEP